MRHAHLKRKHPRSGSAARLSEALRSVIERRACAGGVAGDAFDGHVRSGYAAVCKTDRFPFGINGHSEK